MDELKDYDFELPEQLIAREPGVRRDGSRLLVVHRDTGDLEHHEVCDLPSLLNRGDALVFNDTKVLPARLFGHRKETEGKWEGLFLELREDGLWRLMSKTRGRLRPGELVRVEPAHQRESVPAPEPFEIRLVEQDQEGCWFAACDDPREVESLLQEFGTMPLPPYMKRSVANEDDWERYQTTYARQPGAVAAPTAGLHFSDELIAACDSADLTRSFVTLHVGIGTFRPISVERLKDHRMHSEWCEISESTVDRLKKRRDDGGRIVAVGTTSVRTLESASRSGELKPMCGPTELFIRPPYEFQSVDALFTNFHLPKSSLLVMISAFAGRELILRAYEEAVRESYRFYSYGDAMLIL